MSNAPGIKFGPWPEKLNFEAECVAVRKDQKHLPIIIRADNEPVCPHSDECGYSFGGTAPAPRGG